MLFLRPFNEKITWIQGVVPEEAWMVFRSRWRMWMWEAFEFFTLKYSAFIFFVSDRMLDHYKNKYSYSKDNYFIMPCFNKQLNHSSFEVTGKYTRPTFVYAGKMSKWQCIERTLGVFKIIESEIPSAHLSLLTSDREEAFRLLAKYRIKNAEVKFCSLNDIDIELSKFKYGFILREDDIVNRVATPTKMSTYLANGVIPVYTDVIDDFKEPFNNINNKIELSSGLSVEEIARIVIEFENRQINHQLIKDEYGHLFATYFNRKKYMNAMQAEILKLEEKFTT